MAKYSYIFYHFDDHATSQKHHYAVLVLQILK